MTKILVVDDSANERERIVNLLTPLGYEVDTAQDGDEALTLLEINTYSLLITDLLMPGNTGFQLLATIQGWGIKPPIIICSAYVTHEVEKHLKFHELVEIVNKPYKPETLLAAVDKLLGSTDREEWR